MLCLPVLAGLAALGSEYHNDVARGGGNPVEPADLHALECAIHSFAHAYGVSKVPSSDVALAAALNLDNCTDVLRANTQSDRHPRIQDQINRIQQEAIRLAETRPLIKRANHRGPALGKGTPMLFISPTGSDTTGTGTETNPFASFARAADAAAAMPQRPLSVVAMAGKYYFNETLLLGPKHSGVSFVGMGKVVLSGGARLNPKFQPSTINPKILVAPVDASMLQSEAERAFWSKQAASKQSTPDVRGATTADPPVPSGWTQFPGHCMSNSGCTSAHCNCADPPIQLKEVSCPDQSACFNKALADCTSTSECQGFAVMANMKQYELFSLNNWSAVPNPDWNAYGKDSATPPPGPPPPTPPVPPPPHKWGAPPAKWNTLHIDGVRQVRARYPNANPQDNSGKCFSKIQHPGEGCDGYMQASGQAGGSLPGGTKVYGYTSGLDRNKAPATPTDGGGSYGTFHYTIYDPPAGHPVYNKPMPDWSWTNNSYFTFWGDPLSRPAGVKYGSQITKNYSNAGTGVVHMFHGGLWGGWQYQVSEQVTDGSQLMFSHGGYQEGRGSGIGSNHFFIENVLEELDVPGEWFYDPVASMLYVYPNSTDGSPGTEIVAPLLSAVVRVEGAENVEFYNFQITETRATYLDAYEVPSGGDWSVHRGAAFEIVDSNKVMVSNITFEQIGGNGVLMSNNVTESGVTNCEFVQVGDSAIVAIGSSEGIVGMKPTYPRHNIIEANHMHEIGVYGKQVSCYFQALGQENQLVNNLCYNGPRAGINWNDGFAGGSLVAGNLVFNMVRETGDHGPYNSWDRQPYLTQSGVVDGYTAAEKCGYADASIVKAHDTITHNFFINGYNGVWTIDHDDGSQYFNDTENFMVFGGCKNYLGNHKSCDHNVIIHPGIASRATGSRRCQTDDNKVFQNQYHDNNHCVTVDGVFYTMAIPDCKQADIDPHVYQTFNNTLYSNGSVFSNGPCSTFAEWQSAGQDRDSHVLPMPSISDIVAMGKAVLQQE